MIEFNAAATRAVHALAATSKQFTVDEVHHMLRSYYRANDPEDNKALGGVVHHLSTTGYIEPQYSWFTSVRKTDRPIRVWMGTVKLRGPEINPTEDEIVAALEAIEAVGRRRSEILHEQIRRSRRTSGVAQAV